MKWGLILGSSLNLTAKACLDWSQCRARRRRNRGSFVHCGHLAERRSNPKWIRVSYCRRLMQGSQKMHVILPG